MQFLLPILALAAAPVTHCVARETRDAAGALAAERRWVDAIERRDARALGCILDSDFTDIDWRGAIRNREDMLRGFAQKPHVHLTLDQMSVKLDGDMAIVRGRNRETDATGKIVGAVRFTDIFVYRGNAWHALFAQETVIR